MLFHLRNVPFAQEIGPGYRWTVLHSGLPRHGSRPPDIGTGVRAQLAARNCSWLVRAARNWSGLIGMLRSALGCLGLVEAVRDCSGLLWPALERLKQLGAVLDWSGLLWPALERLKQLGAVLDWSGLSGTSLGFSGFFGAA